jgi:nucleoside-diphosphate-sugar epimerase
MGLTVAVTGPTGEIGRSAIRALEGSDEVERIVGMARRPFDPAEHGWHKTTYRQGDMLDRAAVDALVAGADVVLHLAFIILEAADAHDVNVEGSRNVFHATVAAGVPRLVYASSVAAYGFHADNPQPLTEDVPARGTPTHPYSAQKAQLEAVLRTALEGGDTQAWVVRPCIVAGPDATMLIDAIPYTRMAGLLPGPVREALGAVPLLKPVLPDPGIPLQLVHHDDVAEALRLCVLGRGTPGVYNLAATDELRVRDIADALGWHAVPVPDVAVDATAELATRLPFLPPEARWMDTFRVPVIMDVTKAMTELGWVPRHSALETLRQTVAGHREAVGA